MESKLSTDKKNKLLQNFQQIGIGMLQVPTIREQIKACIKIENKIAEGYSKDEKVRYKAIKIN